MKYFGGFVAAFVLAAITGVAPVAAVNVNNFVISDYRVDMTISRDSENRSVLETRETITAEFPNYDQNHGPERSIPNQYDGHDVSLAIKSVRDDSGAALEYSTYQSNGNTVVRIGSPDRYVHGTNVYVLEYTQRDVTRYFSDTDDDEFYWDINGVDWRVPIERLQTTIAVSDELAPQLNGQVACYSGVAGSSDQCTLAQNGNQFTNDTASLAAGQNVTVAIGFVPQTFAQYEMSLLEMLAGIWIGLQIGLACVTIVVIIWLIVRYVKLSNREAEIGPIAPEYLPPSDASVTLSSQITSQTKGSVMTAQLLDLAVRHYVRLYEVKEKKWYRAAEYEIEITKDPSDLRDEEKELLSDSFGSLPTVGQRLNLKSLQNNTAYRLRTADNDKKLDDAIRGKYGLRRKDDAMRAVFRRTAKMIALFGVVLLSPSLLFAALVATVLSYTIAPLTDKGLALRRYLRGLKLYIGVAEADRLKMLQSPEGAEKIAAVSVSSTDQRSLVKLYERVLPYAVLFGQEKEWSRQLGAYYEQANAQPDWYTGTAAFNAAAFSSAIGGISQAASYASSSSSSSGGSSGGGSSGGGGGGGGGGGW